MNIRLRIELIFNGKYQYLSDLFFLFLLAYFLTLAFESLTRS